jgi:hypothetical protein
VDPAHDGGAAHRVSALQEPVLEYPENPPPQGEEGMRLIIPLFFGTLLVAYLPRKSQASQRLARMIRTENIRNGWPIE